MKLRRYRRTLARPEWIRHPARLEHAGELVAAPCEVWAAEPAGDRLVLVAVPVAGLEPLRAACAAVRVAASPRTSAMVTYAKIFGYQPRFSLRHDFCTAAALNREQPDAAAVLTWHARVAELKYHEHNPDLCAEHALALRGVRPCWRIDGGAFTSGIVNRDNPLRYHTDTGNFPRLWSVMFVMPRHVRGGELVLPELGLALRFAEDTAVMFAGQELIHGVTPIQRTRADGARHSVVYYALRGMCGCLEPGDELARIRTVRTEREGRRARGETPPDPRRGDWRWKGTPNGRR